MRSWDYVNVTNEGEGPGGDRLKVNGYLAHGQRNDGASFVTQADTAELAREKLDTYLRDDCRCMFPPVGCPVHG